MTVDTECVITSVMYLPIVLGGGHFDGPMEKELNNPYTLANGFLRSGVNYQGYPDDDRDFFSFFMPTDGQISVNLTEHVGKGVQLHLYYETVSEGSLVKSVVKPPFTIVHDGLEGWYYIFIYTESGYTRATPYTLRVTHASLPPTLGCTPAPPTPTPTATATPTPTVTPTPAPTITITEPLDIVTCTNPPSDPFCKFGSRGTTSGTQSIGETRIYTFVFPLNPQGCGWYIQENVTAPEADGTWKQPLNFLGSVQYPAQTGHTLQFRAALVHPDATYDGVPLRDLRAPACLRILEDIEGRYALSNTVELTVQR